MESQITVFIDEGGDPGVKDGLRFADSRYEWFTLGAYVVRSQNDPATVTAVKSIRDMVRGGQRPVLHYAQLPLANRKPACEYLASVPARAFCLQLADVVAIAFYQAANRQSPNWNVEPALALAPIVASANQGSAKDIGVTVWPLSHQGKLPEESMPIFEKYGYRFK